MKRINCLYKFCAILLILNSCSSENDPLPDQAPDPDISQESSHEFIKFNIVQDSIFTINSIVQLSDGSYTLAGAVRSNGNDGENLIMKLDKYGNREWLKVMENTYTPRGIENLFKEGNGYIGYRSHSYGSGDPPQLINFNSEGEVINQIPISGNIFVGQDIIRAENSFIIAGRRNDMLFKKIGMNGETHWTQSFHFYPEASSISRLNDGSFITIGGWGSSINGEYLMKLSSSGEIVWSKPYKGFKVLVLEDQGFVGVTGYPHELYFIRFDENGNELWKKPLDGALFNTNRTISIFDYNMEYFVCTYINEEGYFNFLVLDTEGNEINKKTIDNFQHRNSYTVIKTNDDGIFIARIDRMNKLDFFKLSSESVFSNTQNN